jgi:hypothetical protein
MGLAEARASFWKAEQRKAKEERAEMGQPEGADVPRFLIVTQKIKETIKIEISCKGKEPERANTGSAERLIRER